MQFLLLLFTAGAVTAAATQNGQSADGRQQRRTREPAGYSFGYGPAHSTGGGASWRKESADAAGNVIGSYGLKDPDGRVRLVTYVANQDGFQANVQSNEPGLPQHNLGLGAGVTQWLIPQAQPHGHQAGVLPGTPGQRSSATGRGTLLSSGHVDAPGGAPYSFSYDSSAVGGPFQQEAGDALGNKRGTYGLPGRTVNYAADANGFRASVQSNEPGVDNSHNPADVVFTGSASGRVPPPRPSALSRSSEDGDSVLVYPPPYHGSGASPSGGPGSMGTGGDGTHDTSGGHDDGGFGTPDVVNQPGANDVENPADVDVYKRPGPAGITLVYFGPPGSAPSGAALIPPSGFGTRAHGIPFGPFGGGIPASPGSTRPFHTGYTPQGGSGVYNFAYGGGQIQGPWQRESGHAAGNEGSYGLTVNDGRFRTVGYVPGTDGFRASTDANEQGLDGTQNPADVSINKTPESAGVVTAGDSHGLSSAGQSTGSGAFPGTQGQVVVPAAPLRPALIGRQGVLLVPGSTAYPGVQEQAVVPVGPARPPFSGQPAVSVVPSSIEFTVIHGPPSGQGAPDLNVPVSTGNVVSTSPALGSTGGYSFGYRSAPGGASQHEAASGAKNGVYGFSGDGGDTRKVNYVVDNAGFRASVQRNAPGFDTSQNPADVSLSQFGGVPAIHPPSSSVLNTPLARHHVTPGSHTHVGTPHFLGSQAGYSSPGSPWPAFSHGPGGFSYTTKVYGPHQSVTNVHHF